MVVCFINVEVILIIVGKCAWRFSRFLGKLCNVSITVLCQ